MIKIVKKEKFLSDSEEKFRVTLDIKRSDFYILLSIINELNSKKLPQKEGA